MKLRGKRKRQKFGNIKVVHDGITFDSTKEGDRYLFLKSKQEEGAISELQMQVVYELIPKQTKLVEKRLKTKSKMVEVIVERAERYKADFVYSKNGNTIVEDVKGSERVITRDFKIKKKLMYYVWGIELRIVFNPEEPV